MHSHSLLQGRHLRVPQARSSRRGLLLINPPIVTHPQVYAGLLPVADAARSVPVVAASQLRRRGHLLVHELLRLEEAREEVRFQHVADLHVALAEHRPVFGVIGITGTGTGVGIWLWIGTGIGTRLAT